MANYKGIKGFKVQSLASDPSVPIGQVWYNTTSNALKYQALGAGSWASGGTCNNGRANLAGAGISTAAVMMGGIPFPAPGVAGKLQEEYNGSAWTEVSAEMASARSYFAAWGTKTAAMTAGGQTYPPALLATTELYNGTSWSEESDLNTARKRNAGGGTQTAALVAGGALPALTDIAEDWNGASWTAVPTINTARQSIIGAANMTPTTGLVFGGLAPGDSALTESFNGTSWTVEATLGTARYQMGGAGTSTIALCFGGNGAGPSAQFVESWDGSTWTEVADLGSGRSAAGSGGNSSASDAFISAGNTHPPAGILYTDIWTKAATVKTVTVT